MDSTQKQTFFTFEGDVSGPAAYAGVCASSDVSIAAKAAAKYLKDSSLLSKLTERVYELLLEDLRSQRDRLGNYGNERWL